MTKKKKKGKERSQQNLYRPKSVPKKTVPSKPKPTPAQLKDPEFSDDDTDYVVDNDDEGRLIVFPKRSVVLSTLPVAVREELQKNSIVSNHEDLANICLSRERSALVNGKECFTLTDSNGRIHLFWIPSKVSSKSVFRNGNMNAAGYIRDQFDHPLCWDFSFCDLLSATCVLYGHMQRYEPLSQIYVCQHVDRSNYKKKKVVTDHDTKQKRCHSCYEDSMYNALKYLTNSKGIPKAEKREIGEFDCNQERSLKRGEELFGKIKNVYRYKQLKDALKRLRTHPVTATLICFEGWQNPGIYKGPYSGPQPPYYMGEHQVVMLDCVKHEGTVVIRCKSSNGVDTGNDGYLFIDPEI
ncbi:hypothetical protein ARALYDRAFT_899939 [Arabidopsis lyrata subsp. lyrata]|uniref:Peptidase C1A papain C-terminal domain-containing protein n=1 Tax=Arabidopsis lyrata subsp. lyrata TaxID=81972 RepID=D7L704_ARALL|nr:hypothetical protein ARALYDRAFT_899939 [Arabidopsis lyrata subsp. lyrata]